MIDADSRTLNLFNLVSLPRQIASGPLHPALISSLSGYDLRSTFSRLTPGVIECVRV